MARKPTPAGATPADTTPPAAAPAAAAPAAAAPAQPANPEPAPAASEPSPADEGQGSNGTPEPSTADVTPARDEGEAPSDVDLDPLVMHDARVLIAFDGRLPDAIVSGTLAELRVLERDGKVDTHPDAVAYVRSQQA